MEDYTKKCKTCRHTMSVMNFYSSSIVLKSGEMRTVYGGDCKQCISKKGKKRYAETKKSSKSEIKVERPAPTVYFAVCTKCKTKKTPNEFYSNPTTKSKLQSQCKDCCKAAAKAKRDKMYAVKRQKKQEDKELINALHRMRGLNTLLV